MTDKIKGGLADHKKDSNYSANQLRKGIKVEMEHTDKPSVAKEIAKDHLEESSTYYDHLEKMEKKMEKSAFWLGFEKESAARSEMLSNIPMAAPNLVGGLLGTIIGPYTADQQRRVNKRSISNWIPGVGGYRLGRRMAGIGLTESEK